MQTLSTKQLAWFTAIGAVFVIGWDLSALDLPLARLSGGLKGFPLQDHWLFANVLHKGARWLAWGIAVLLCVGVWFPVRWLDALPFRRRLQLAASALLCVTLISSIKAASNTSCPWSLAEFGGLARYVSHWSLSVTDGGSGGCFPAGHASAGFAFIGGYFAFRHDAPRMARSWLALSLIAGLVLGISQQVRGAHYMSHTLWTGWLCWTLAWLIDCAIEHMSFARVSADLGEAV